VKEIKTKIAKKFFSLLGGSIDSPINSAEKGGDDAEAERDGHRTRQLWRLSDASGKMEFSKISEGNNIKKSQLDGNDVFIFDAGHEIFAWIGKGASDKEKFEAMVYAQQYLSKNKRPLYLPILVIGSLWQ